MPIKTTSEFVADEAAKLVISHGGPDFRSQGDDNHVVQLCLLWLDSRYRRDRCKMIGQLDRQSEYTKDLREALQVALAGAKI